MICALAFVPPADIKMCFTRNCGATESPILDYFETNYVGELHRGVRRPLTFEHSLYSNINVRISTIIADYANRTTDYLRAISHNIL